MSDRLERLIELIEEARLAGALGDGQLGNDRARAATVALGLEGDEAMLACRLLAGGADPASLDYLDTGSVSERIQAAHTGGPGVFEADNPNRMDYLALCALSADESLSSTVRSRFWHFHEACTRLASQDDLFRDAAMDRLGQLELEKILALPFKVAKVGGVNMRIYDTDRGFAAAVWDQADPQQVAAVLSVSSKDGSVYLQVGAPPYCPTLEDQGIAIDKPLYPRYGIVEDKDEVARIVRESGWHRDE